ncbi:C45 family autoproteolytic acyltransferase/hydolase [Motilimonas sp. KMU-193]|uniref:C45 family autoproteolytic acyltransferase/hydolase n=1 Tax=Motilimonas sp. KMU-193 TaxID=3388668 RepID=UPI00396B0DE8
MSKGRLTLEQGVKTLIMKGSHYEMGFQHGYLLAAQINTMIQQTQPAAIAVIAKTLQHDWDKAERAFHQGAKVAEEFVPECLLEEMRGIAEGAQAAGFDISLEQIQTWNTMYDQWCIYAHPYYWNVFDEENKGHYPAHGAGTRVLTGAGCSSFSAWDDTVGSDGELIFCKNEDNLNLPGQLENRYIFISVPDQGQPHLFLCFPGMVGFDGGFNTAGISVMTQYDASIDETMRGYGLGVLTRLALLNATSLEQALDTFRHNPRRTGIAYHCADANNRCAAVIEASAKITTVRYPMNNTSCLWQTNHSICYPGYMGYSGYNYALDQQQVYALGPIDNIPDYLEQLRHPYNFIVPAPSRFERYQTLLHEYYGQINVANAIKIMSDRFDPFTQLTREQGVPSFTNNILATISAYYSEETFTTPKQSFAAGVANLWCLIAYPNKGDFYLAIEGFPANQHGFKKFNLLELLQKNTW